MVITINIVRSMQTDGTILEIFTWNPNVKYYYDESRILQRIIKFTIAKKSMHSAQKIKLTDIIYMERSIIYKYEHTEERNVQMTEQIDIEYNPVLGLKKCMSCLHLKIFNKKLVCLFRGSKGGSNIKFKGCLDWSENYNWLEIRKKRKEITCILTEPNNKKWRNYSKNITRKQTAERRRLEKATSS